MSRLLRNILSNLIGQGLVLGLSFLALKFIYGRLGDDAVGIIYFSLTMGAVLTALLEMGIFSTIVREVASHFDISIGLTLALIEGQDDVQPARDRTSFFINPRSETAPVVYEYAYLNLAGYGKDPIHERVVQTFEQTISRCRTTAPDLVGPGYFAPMRLDEFVASRIVEAVVHGIDVTQALGRTPVAGPDAVAFTASILDDLLARRTVGTRPPDLADDLAWVRAASGRADHADNRLPLIG